MLKLEDISIYYKNNNKSLAEGLNFQLNIKDRCAIIGEEGIGKSTLLRFLYNENLIKSYCYYNGKIKRKKINFQYIEQELSDEWNDCYTNEFFFKTNPHDVVEKNSIKKSMEILDILKTLNINENLLEYQRRIGTLSKGERMKLQIAKIMLSKPKVVLLDETTNNLDIDTVAWIEKYINSINVSSIFVAHDETLLENIATRIFFLKKKKNDDGVTCILEDMSYDDFINTKFSEHQLLIDLDEHAKYYLKNAVKIPSNKEIVKYEWLNLYVGQKSLASNISFKVVGPQHVVITGQSGSGKTTLLKKIYDDLSKKTDIKLGYLPENYESILNLNIPTNQFLYESRNDEDTEKAKAYVSLLNLTNEELNDNVSNLSSGQKIKVIILKLILTKCNVLLLDEPTRDLSPFTIRTLRKMLKNYGGTIISTSHDRKYIDEVCDTVYELKANGLFLIKSKNN